MTQNTFIAIILTVIILILIYVSKDTLVAQQPLMSGDIVKITNDSTGSYCHVDEKTKYVSCTIDTSKNYEDDILQFRLFKVQPSGLKSIAQLTQRQINRNNQIWNGDKIVLVDITGKDCHVTNPAQSHWRGSSPGIMRCERKERDSGNVLTIKSYDYPNAKKPIVKGAKVTFSKPDPTFRGIVNYCRQDDYKHGKDYMKCIGTRMTDNTIYRVMSARMSPDMKKRGKSIEIA